jgi:GMP synthase (glutamine-hydrolysing)
MKEQIIILDFGSQYTQVIARRIRECQVYSTILRYDTPAAEIAKMKPKGIILSGGPSSVFDEDAPKPDPALFKLKVPVCWAYATVCKCWLNPSRGAWSQD